MSTEPQSGFLLHDDGGLLAESLNYTAIVQHQQVQPGAWLLIVDGTQSSQQFDQLDLVRRQLSEQVGGRLLLCAQPQSPIRANRHLDAGLGRAADQFNSAHSANSQCSSASTDGRGCGSCGYCGRSRD